MLSCWARSVSSPAPEPRVCCCSYACSARAKKVVEVTPADAVPLIGGRQPFGGVVAQRLEHAVAGHSGVRPSRSQPATSRQARRARRRSRRRQLLVGAHLLGVRERPAAGEYGQTPEQHELSFGPGDRDSNRRSLATSADARAHHDAPPVSSLKRSSSRRRISSGDSARVRAAASSIASGIPSSRRQRSATASASV